jgi:hypothetical protein
VEDAAALELAVAPRRVQSPAALEARQQACFAMRNCAVRIAPWLSSFLANSTLETIVSNPHRKRWVKQVSETMKKRAVLLVLLVPVACSTACASKSSDTNEMKPGKGAGSGGSAAKPSKNSKDAGSAAHGDGGADAMAQDAATDASSTMSDSGISASCQGFSLKDLNYSPGGTTLPNKCKPFDPTTNNPYAVRCVDAWPWYKTKFPGDQYCILPPPPDKGIQYGVHPQGKQWFAQVSSGDMSGYAKPSDDFVMEDGQEEQFNYETGVDTDKDQNYYRNYARMRPGSHHMIVSTDDGTAPQEVWGPPSTEGLFRGTSLPGAQRPDENAPKSLAKPSEDKGLYSVLPTKAGVIFNMHHFNVSGGEILKEAWTNLWWESDATIQVHGILGLELSQTRTLNVPPGSIQDLHYSWDITQPIRVLTNFGHRHAWTTNFSSWIEKSDGKLDILYQSYNWLDEPTYRYDSMTQNPTPAPTGHSDGGYSGVRTLMPGEKLHFNCHIEYTDERATEVKAPMPAQPLHFANEAFSAEMCILFGSTAAVSLGTPQIDTSKLPAFAAQR